MIASKNALGLLVLVLMSAYCQGVPTAPVLVPTAPISVPTAPTESPGNPNDPIDGPFALF